MDRNAYGDRFRREDIYPPKPKPEKLRRVTGYMVMYGGSMHHHSRRGSRLYTKDAAERIAHRLERRGISAYIEPLKVFDVPSRIKLRSIRKSKTRVRRSR